MAILVQNNFCIAPFTQLTFSPGGAYSPCPEIGGRPWRDSTTNPINMWSSVEFQKLRTSFLENKKNPICNRCWNQENNGKQSLRKRLLSNTASGGAKFKKGELLNFLEHGYVEGPKQINLMVGNLCNLRCRTCRAGSSVTYNVEGRHYKKKHNLSRIPYITRSNKAETFSADQIDQVFKISKNLQRIEFYGGEPLLDVPTLSLLEKLIASGQSSNIVLFYNTNGTVLPTEQHYSLWNHFAGIEFNFSIDDIDGRYSYNRHPGTWNNLISNIESMRSYAWRISAKFFSICTISNLNVYYLPEILDRLDQLDLKVFLNHVYDPNWYAIQYLPMAIKEQIVKKLSLYPDSKRLEFVLNMLEAPENLNHWEEFKFWTKEKDLYREEKFSLTYPEFYNILKSYDNTF